MKPIPDSPELTAYVLGELPPADAARIASCIAADPALAAEVESIRRAVEGLSLAFEAEAAPALSEGQRESITRAAGRRRPEAQARPSVRPAKAGRWWDWMSGWPAWGVALAGAAALALTISTRPRQLDGIPAMDDTGPGLGLGGGAEGRPEQRLAKSAPLAFAPSNGSEAPARTLAELPAGIPASPAPAVQPASPSVNTSRDKAKVQPQRATPTASPSSRAEAVSRYLAAESTPAPVAANGPAAAARPVPPPLDAPVAPGVGGFLGGSVANGRVAGDAPAEVRLSGKAVAAPAVADAKKPEVSAKSAPSTDPSPEYSLRANGLRADRFGRGSSPAGPIVAGATPAPAADALAVTAGRDARQVETESVRTVLPARGAGIGEPAVSRFHRVAENPVSTVDLDVDTASYPVVRRFLRNGVLPPADAVRIEGMVNYFRHDPPSVRDDQPVAVQAEIGDCPWAPGHLLARVAVKARELPSDGRPAANLVFLVDVGASMGPEDRLPLVQQTLRLLPGRLSGRDRMGIVTYAGDAVVALEPTPGDRREAIMAAIDRLKAGGSAHGGGGIRAAYAMARGQFVEGGVNRVILCTHDDFNVGITRRDELLAVVREQARSGVFLTVLGYGVEDPRDPTMQLLADNGKGVHATVDSLREAQKVIADQVESTGVTVAKDARLHVEFNPARVLEWRLLGHEMRPGADRDSRGDAGDGVDLGAGRGVVALYELVPVAGAVPAVDPLRRARSPVADGERGRGAAPDELASVTLRYTLPATGASRLLQVGMKDGSGVRSRTSDDFRFASAVAGFGMLLRQSPDRGGLDHDRVLGLAEGALGGDREGERAEFVDLVRRAKALSGK